VFILSANSHLWWCNICPAGLFLGETCGLKVCSSTEILICFCEMLQEVLLIENFKLVKKQKEQCNKILYMDNHHYV
jgi:hypothetical protein